MMTTVKCLMVRLQVDQLHISTFHSYRHFFMNFDLTCFFVPLSANHLILSLHAGLQVDPGRLHTAVQA